MRAFRVAALMALTMLAAPAAAAWQRAETAHFVVYSDGSESSIRKQATDLELFDSALRRFQRVEDTPDSRHNKVTVYVLPSIQRVRDLAGSGHVAGFYVPRVGGSVAFTPRAGDDFSRYPLSPRIVLFHEYAHHFLLGNFTAATPKWFAEGYAEFASTAVIDDDRVLLGAAANHRAHGLTYDGRLTLEQLFEPPAQMTVGQTESLYARGWLLTHLVLFDPARRQQLARYLALVNDGTPGLTAATQAFGDLRQLDRDLDATLRARLTGYSIQRRWLPVPEVALRPLTPGERALIDLRIQSSRGVDRATAATLLARARAAAAPFAGDAVAQGWLAEMAFDAGDDAAAEAAADAALAVDPRSSQALLYKARVHLRRARGGGAADRWQEARGWILRANRVDNDDPAALLLYYQSFAMAGERPSPGAIAGLYRAVDLAPQAETARYLAARQLLLDNDLATARSMLRSLANAPHAPRDNPAARLLAALDRGETGPAALAALAAAARGEANGGD